MYIRIHTVHLHVHASRVFYNVSTHELSTKKVMALFRVCMWSLPSAWCTCTTCSQCVHVHGVITCIYNDVHVPIHVYMICVCVHVQVHAMLRLATHVYYCKIHMYMYFCLYVVVYLAAKPCLHCVFAFMVAVVWSSAQHVRTVHLLISPWGWQGYVECDVELWLSRRLLPQLHSDTCIYMYIVRLVSVCSTVSECWVWHVVHNTCT